jgi:heat shock protein HslJ
MRVVRSVLVPAVLGALLGGCSMFESSTPTGVKPLLPKTPPKLSLPFPVDRTMVAVSYKDQLFKDDRPTLLVSANYRGTGFSACNNWSATVVPRADQRLGVGPIAISKRTCDERLMHNEQVFLFVFKTAQTWSYDGRVLTVTSPYGDMKFESAV